MKHLFTKIVAFMLASSVLFMSSTYAIDKHYCCKMLVDTAIFGSAKSCKDIAEQKDSPFRKCTDEDDSCCKDQVIVKKGDDTIIKTSTEFETETIIFLNTFFYTYINLFEGLEKNIVPFKQYRPPLLSKEIQVLYETYLI